MISIKTPYEIELMEIAGRIVGETHRHLETYIKPGITTKKLDELAYNFIIKSGAIPSFKDYDGFPASICTSINEEVVHGIPSDRKLKNGDIISIDIGACYKGYHGDSAWTYPVGEISSEKKMLLEHTEQSLYEGLAVIKAGARVGDIGYAISKYIKKFNLGVVRELVGHGVGSQLHEMPDVPNYGVQGTGPILKEGMVIAVEPMINLGTREVFIGDDEWTVVTGDDSPSAHFEHTVLVTKEGFKILTKR
ncbi:MAG: type I methionyl aminopeptidase [Bacilli bacterium]